MMKCCFKTLYYLSVPESHLTALNHFGLYYYYNKFVLLLEKYGMLCVNFFSGILSFIFSFAFVVFLVNCLFIFLKLSICSALCLCGGLTCFICCRICQWITLFILFLALHLQLLTIMIDSLLIIKLC